jgi:hypothetical protein
MSRFSIPALFAHSLVFLFLSCLVLDHMQSFQSTKGESSAGTITKGWVSWVILTTNCFVDVIAPQPVELDANPLFRGLIFSFSSFFFSPSNLSYPKTSVGGASQRSLGVAYARQESSTSFWSMASGPTPSGAQSPEPYVSEPTIGTAEPPRFHSTSPTYSVGGSSPGTTFAAAAAARAASPAKPFARAAIPTVTAPTTPWLEYKSDTGLPYFYNPVTAVTVWELPPGETSVPAE